MPSAPSSSRAEPAPEVAALFPSGVEAFSMVGAGDPAELFPAEAEVVASAVVSRQEDFAAGRACARAGIEALGLEPVAIGSGPKREPVWPDGVVGAITHTRGMVLAVVARVADLGDQSIGVDAERVGRVTPNLYSKLFTPAEAAWIAGDQNGADGADEARRATTLFSAKEAYYKAQFPITGEWVGFTDVRIREDHGVLEVDRVGHLGALDALLWPQPIRALHRPDVVVAAAIARPASS